MKNKGYFLGRKNDGKKPSRKVMVIIIAAIIVFIPAISALLHYAFGDTDANENPNNFMQVSLYREDELLFEEKEDPERAAANTLVSLFDSMIKNMTETDALPSAEEVNLFRAVVTTSDTQTTYNCYFSPKSENSYMTDSSKKTYLVSPADAQAFMTSVYAETTYNSSIPPKLYSTSEDIILPSSADWKYKDISGAYKVASKVLTRDTELQYDMAGALGLSFDREPDTCSVKIYKSGIIIHSGSHKDLSLITVDPGTVLQFKVEATWNTSAEIDCYGTVIYNFKVLLRDRAEFILDKTELSTGDFIVVAATNVIDTDRISFSASPSIGFDPVFIQDGDVVRALIPFSDKLSAGKYSLTFSYGASEQTAEINLSERTASESPYIVSNSNKGLFKTFTNPASANELDDIMNSLKNSHIEYIFSRNAFKNYADSGRPALYVYGSRFETEDSVTQHTLKGEFWTTDAVTALNGGYVIYSGECSYLGKFAVIEHGLGLRTLYGQLSSLNVSEGDYVVGGQNIGRAGKISENSPAGVLIQCYIFGVAVDYSKLAGQTLPLYVIPNEDIKQG